MILLCQLELILCLQIKISLCHNEVFYLLLLRLYLLLEIRQLVRVKRIQWNVLNQVLALHVLVFVVSDCLYVLYDFFVLLLLVRLLYFGLVLGALLLLFQQLANVCISLGLCHFDLS